MKKIFLILIFLIFIPTVFAENGIEIKIINNTLSVRGYTNDPIYGKVDFGFFQKINDSIGQLIKCDNIVIGNDTYQKNCSVNIDYLKDIPIYGANESSTSIIGDSKLYHQLIDCETLKAQYNAGLSSCVSDKSTLVDYQNNYTQCNTDIQICRSDKNSLESEVSGLNKDIEDNKNRQYWFGAVGLIVGGVVIAYRAGMIFAPKAKRAEETYNPRQAA